MPKHYTSLVRGCGLHLHHLKNGRILSGEFRRSLPTYQKHHQPQLPIVKGKGIHKVVKEVSKRVMRPLKFKF
jgi:hypothetical protein